MKAFFLFLFCFFSLCLPAQEPAPNGTSEKGVTPINKNQTANQQTFAVVVGISDYQDINIPDLRFADKDAEAFAAFLQSPAGGRLQKDHLKVLLNEQATAAQFAIALDWLWEIAQENDRVIIYFSGHGDVERKSLTQPGYLLCWDAPSRVYMAGGTLSVRNLNDVVSTLSIQNKAKVILITDACRAGKLSGNGIGGAQTTSANLARQFANEIKILSCQPNEYSIEGEQWGGGRGVFSYHLLDGLTGMADANADLTVNLKEIRRYLEDYVSEEVAPQSQIPMVVGDKTEKLTDVFPDILAQLKAGKKEHLQLFSSTDSRGIEEDVLAALSTSGAKADSNIVEMYLAFQEAIRDKRFLEPAAACADFFYEKLSREPKLAQLHSRMRRNYAAALQDDAQQVINSMLQTGFNDWKLRLKRPMINYKKYPAYLERAAELLGRDHQMYDVLMARKNYFGMFSSRKRAVRDSFLRKSLSYQPEMPLALAAMIRNFDASQVDSAEVYFQKAITAHPLWTLPYEAKGFFYRKRLKDPKKEEAVYIQAGQLNPEAPMIWFKKAKFYRTTGKYALSEKWYQKLIGKLEKDGNLKFPRIYLDLGRTYLKMGKDEEARTQFTKAIEEDSAFAHAYHSRGQLSLKNRQLSEAKGDFKTAIQLDSTLWSVYFSLADWAQIQGKWQEALDYALQALEVRKTSVWIGPPKNEIQALIGHALTHLPGRFPEAKAALDKALAQDENFPLTYIYLAHWHVQNQQVDEAWNALEKGLKKGYRDLEYLQSNPEFQLLSQDPKWKALMESYFPDEWKE